MIKEYYIDENNPLQKYENIIGKFVSDVIGIKLDNFKIDFFDRFIIDSNNILEFSKSLNGNIENDKIRFFFDYIFYNFPNNNNILENLINFYNIKRPTEKVIKRKQVFSIYLNKNIDSKNIFNIFPVKIKEVLIADYIMIEGRPYLIEDLDEFSELLQHDILKNFQVDINFKDNNEKFNEKLKILEMLII